MQKAMDIKNIELADVVGAAIQIQGVKVNREAFLREQFKEESKEHLNAIIEVGPVEAQCEQNKLKNIANKIVNDRTLFSTGASFVAGMPGGLAMAATIPADLIQFYGVALRLAQEVAYLYGEGDLWSGEKPDSEKVTNQLILYCGVMLGVSGAAQTVRVLSSSLAKQVLKKLPQKALTKTIYYPIVKSIAKAFGAKMTKEVFAKGVSKAIPFIGGVISGGITFATMKPMGRRLIDALDEAHYSYSQAEFEADWKDIMDASAVFEESEGIVVEVKEPQEKPLEKIKQAKELLDAGAISEEDFAKIKEKLISQM